MSNPKSCLHCAYYYSTFDPVKPRGCKFYGFESRSFPNLVVKKESGDECSGFSPSKRVKAQEKAVKVSLNDPKYW